MTEPPTIDRDELRAKLDRGDAVTLVEALPPHAYAREHLPGAVNLPPDRTREDAPRVLPDRDAQIVVYCATPTCGRSRKTAATLLDMGYSDVKDYAGGKSDWIDAGLPTEVGEATNVELHG